MSLTLTLMALSSQWCLPGRYCAGAVTLAAGVLNLFATFMLIRADFMLVYVVAAMVKPVLGILLAYPFRGGVDNAFQRLSGRAWAVRSQVLSLLNASSMGLKSGE